MFSAIDWNKNRMIVLTCGHVYITKTMDMHMRMKDYYEGSIEEGWTSIKILPALLINRKTCPTCGTPIKNVKRYGRIINKSIFDMQNKKFILKYDYQLKEIIIKIISLKDEIISTRNKLKEALPKHESRPMKVVFEVQKIVNRNYLKSCIINILRILEHIMGLILRKAGKLGLLMLVNY
jgi:hypothetical protein